MCTLGDVINIPFRGLHSINQWATPNQFMKYKHSLLLYRVFNNPEPVHDWLVLSFAQMLTKSWTTFTLNKTNKFKEGEICLLIAYTS